MFCPKCGKENTNNANFCIACGSKLEHRNESKPIMQKPSKKSRKKFPWLLFIIVLLLILLAGAVFLSLNKEKQAEETSWESVRQALEDSLFVVEAFQNEDGCIETEDAQKAIDAVFEAVKDTEGIVSCNKDEYGVFIEMESGLDFVYSPEITDADAGGESLEIVTLQPYYSENKMMNPSYDHDGLDILANTLSIKDYNWKYLETTGNLDDDEVSLDRILSLDDYKMILWHGHGGYNTSAGFYLCTDIKVTSQLLDNYPCINKNTAVYVLGGPLGLKPAFFQTNFEDGAFENAFIYLGTCFSGKESAMADAFIDKGAAVVFVNSGCICREYNLNMIHFISEAFCLGATDFIDEKLQSINATVNSPENWTIADVLAMAQAFYGKIDSIWHSTEVCYFGQANVSQLTYEQWMNGFTQTQTPEIIVEPELHISEIVVERESYENFSCPEILVGGGNIEDINTELYSRYLARLNDSEYCSMSYDASLYGDIISLCVKAGTIYETTDYYIYNISFDTRTTMTDDELFETINIEKSEFLQDLQGSIVDWLESTFSFDSQIAQEYGMMTVQDSKFEEAVPYIDDGQLMAVSYVYYPAAAGSGYLSLPICELEPYVYE